MTGYRLPTGGRINRAAQVTFSFDGSSFVGFEGDTLASALLASGVPAGKIVLAGFASHRWFERPAQRLVLNLAL